MSVDWEKDNIPAIVEAWYAGENAAMAIADVLFGDFNPGGIFSFDFLGLLIHSVDTLRFSMSFK